MLDQTAEACHSANPARNACVQTAAKPLLAACSVLSSVFSYLLMATVGEKGQIVIPKQAREIFGIKPGDTLFLFGDEKRGIVIPPKEEFSELFGKVFLEKDGDNK